MSDRFTILVADRNPHVREFLRREFMADGYRVRTAKDGQEVLSILAGDEPLDLLILDLEIPYVGGVNILERLRDREPPLPIVIHTLITDYTVQPDLQGAAAVVEKSGNTDDLKAAVAKVLRNAYPARFGARLTRAEARASETHGPESKPTI